MANSVSIDKMASAIAEEMTKYSTTVTEDLKEACNEVAKQTKKEIKANSPKDSGNYSQGWTSKVTAKNSNAIEITIYNKNKPQITHLLENGHAKVNGGRVEGQPHIAPAEQNAIKSLEGKVKVIVK